MQYLKIFMLFILALQYATSSIAAVPSAFTFLTDDIDIEVQADGTWMKEEVAQIRINNQQGIQRVAQLPFTYSSSLEELNRPGYQGGQLV